MGTWNFNLSGPKILTSGAMHETKLVWLIGQRVSLIGLSRTVDASAATFAQSGLQRRRTGKLLSYCGHLVEMMCSLVLDAKGLLNARMSASRPLTQCLALGAQTRPDAVP